MGDVIEFDFRATKPDWVQTACRRHRGLKFLPAVDGGPSMLTGTPVELPSGRTVSGGGYLRTTGQWRQDAHTGAFDVEVYCCKTMQSAWVPAGLLAEPRMIDSLGDL